VVNPNELGLNPNGVNPHDLRRRLTVKQWIRAIHPMLRFFLGSERGQRVDGDGLLGDRALGEIR
jgi:hypothetical protein